MQFINYSLDFLLLDEVVHKLSRSFQRSMIYNINDNMFGSFRKNPARSATCRVYYQFDGLSILCEIDFFV